MSRAAIVWTLLLAVSLTPARAAVRLLSPAEGAQTFGVASIEASTDSAKIDRVEFYVDGHLAGIARQAPYRVQHDFGDGTTPHLVEAVVKSDHFRETERAAVHTAGLTLNTSIDVDLVEIPFRGSFRRMPRASDVTIVENGAKQKVEEIRSDRGATAFTFVVDRSLSMEGAKLAAALTAVEAALQQLRSSDSASLILFNHRVDPPVALTHGKVPDGVTASGGTSLRDALSGIDASRRSVIIIISDGGDRNSRSSAGSVSRVLERRNASIYALLLDTGNAEPLLQELSGKTGGALKHTSPTTLSRDMRALLDEINGRYTAVYQSNNLSKGWRSVTLNVRGGRATQARKGYFSQ